MTIDTTMTPASRWCPDVCPITQRPFFMWIERNGVDLPTYGGPFDSYTIPEKDDDGDWSCYRFDHDAGYWVDSIESTGLLVIDEQKILEMEDREENLRELLAVTYTVKPLEWVYGTDYLGRPTASCDEMSLRVAIKESTEQDREDWGWGYHVADYYDEGGFDCSSLEDGIEKATAFRLARVTAPLVKVEVPS